jgi:hypothetical protein
MDHRGASCRRLIRSFAFKSLISDRSPRSDATSRWSNMQLVSTCSWEGSQHVWGPCRLSPDEILTCSWFQHAVGKAVSMPGSQVDYHRVTVDLALEKKVVYRLNEPRAADRTIRPWFVCWLETLDRDPGPKFSDSHLNRPTAVFIGCWSARASAAPACCGPRSAAPAAA